MASSPPAATWATTAASRPTWTLDHPEKVKDWGLRAHFSVATAAKALSSRVSYDKPVRYSYFEGCSNGGRQAMMMAQNYPELFDGIVAGAPSKFYPDLLMWLLWTGKNRRRACRLRAAVRAAETKRRRSRSACCRRAMRATAWSTARSPTRARATSTSTRSGRPATARSTPDELAVFKAMYAGTTSEAGVQRYPGASSAPRTDWIPLFADNGGYGPSSSHFVYSRNTPDVRLASRHRLLRRYDE